MWNLQPHSVLPFVFTLPGVETLFQILCDAVCTSCHFMMSEPRWTARYCKQPSLHVRLPLVWVRLGVALHAVVYCVASRNHVLGHVIVAKSLLFARPACETPIVPRLIKLQHFDPNGYHIAPHGAPRTGEVLEGKSGTP